MFNIKPVEEGNAQIINEVSLPIVPLVLLRYEAIAEFYSEEPMYIKLKRQKNESSCLFEQVFRFRVWISNEVIYSWIIYSSNREWLNENGNTDGLILRNVVWNRKSDLEIVRKKKNSNRDELLNNWPQIKLKNIYLNPEISTKLIETLQEGDKYLSSGITLVKRLAKLEQPTWRDLEIRRLFDWGSVQALWGPNMENAELEKYCFMLNDYLERYNTETLENVYKMDLDFVYPIEDYKKLISGSYFDSRFSL